MTDPLAFLVELVNGLTTLAAAGSAFYIYRRKKPRSQAFVLWTVGFLLYASEILVRDIFSIPISVGYLALVFIFGFAFLIFGTAVLVDQFRKFSLVFVPMVAVAFILASIGLGSFSEAIVTLGVYGSMAASSYLIAKKLGRIATSFIAGWTALLIANLLLAAGIPIIAVDALAAGSKILIIFGMMDQKFTTLMLRMAAANYPRGLTSELRTGYLRVVVCQTPAKEKQIDWLNERLRKATAERRLTHMIAAYDTPITFDAEELASIYGMVMVKVVSRPSNTPGGSGNPLTIQIGDDPDDLGEFLSLLLRMSARTKIPAEIILIGASWLTRSWGEEKFLSYLVKETSTLRSADLILTCLLYPELHSPQLVSAFQRLATETVEL